MNDDTSKDSDRLVVYIELDPLELAVPHALDDLESSGSNSICDVNVIERRVQDLGESGRSRDSLEDGQIDSQVKTPTIGEPNLTSAVEFM